MTASVSPNKSTNVRTEKKASPARVSPEMRAIRFGIQSLWAVAPKVAAAATARLFLRTPPRPKRVSTFTEGARRLDLGLSQDRLAVWTWGEGPTVLLVHGWGGRAAQMRSFVAPLVSAGHRVVAFDAPGHGSSAGRELSMPSFAAAIRRVGDVFGPVHAVVAHSLGAAASTLAMSDGLAVARAVFLGPPASPVGWFESMARFLQLDATATSAARASLESRVGRRLEDLTAEVLGPQVSTPLLVVHDRGDAEVQWKEGARIARSVPGATMISTEGLGHRRILRDRTVVETAVRFVLGFTVDAGEILGPRCGGCGQRLDRDDDAVCSDCALQRELQDRAARWALQDAKAVSATGAPLSSTMR